MNFKDAIAHPNWIIPVPPETCVLKLGGGGSSSISVG